MTYLVAATVLSTTLTVLNLVVLLGVAARLRELAAGRSRGHPQGHSQGHEALQPVLPPGATPEAFTAVDVDGDPVGAGGARLVAFFAPGCSLCHERMPQVLEYAGRGGLRREDVLAVVIGDGDETDELVAELAPVARVVVEEIEGPVFRAFGVKGLPAMYLMDDRGVIRASGTDLTGFPVTVPA
ncbi:TlpA disulfide reductase family protein [Streptosporangium sp. NPDC051023]|uniref:TlpA disulfide reductase family protein n=1 Tax=Streptosporangium sp. NPDC051023 TaxID=3155410 RepID=UPI00344F1447